VQTTDRLELQRVLDEALGILTADEAVDRITERVVGAGAEVDDRRTRGMKPP
jgi:hypothetical protein